MTAIRVAKLTAQFDRCYAKEEWFAPFTVVMEGVTAAQAAWRPTSAINSIWQIVNHLNFWMERMLQYLTDAPVPSGPADNRDTFGPVGDPADQEGWAATMARSHQLRADLRSFLTGLTDEDLDRPFRKVTVGDLVADLIAHDAHHLGQIILLRKLGENWPTDRN